jgi:hypothetical protein
VVGFYAPQSSSASPVSFYIYQLPFFICHCRNLASNAVSATGEKNERQKNERQKNNERHFSASHSLSGDSGSAETTIDASELRMQSR